MFPSSDFYEFDDVVENSDYKKRFRKAVRYANERKFGEARKSFNELIKLIKELESTKSDSEIILVWMSFVELGNIFSEKEKFDKAIEKYKECIKNREDVERLGFYLSDFYLGYVYCRLYVKKGGENKKLLEISEDHFQRALKIKKDDLKSKLGLGILYRDYLTEKREKALQYLEELVKENNKNSTFLKHKAICHLCLKEFVKPRDFINQVVKANECFSKSIQEKDSEVESRFGKFITLMLLEYIQLLELKKVVKRGNELLKYKSELKNFAKRIGKSMQKSAREIKEGTIKFDVKQIKRGWNSLLKEGKKEASDMNKSELSQKARDFIHRMAETKKLIVKVAKLKQSPSDFKDGEVPKEVSEIEIVINKAGELVESFDPNPTVFLGNCAERYFKECDLERYVSFQDMQFYIFNSVDEKILEGKDVDKLSVAEIIELSKKVHGIFPKEIFLQSVSVSSHGDPFSMKYREWYLSHYQFSIAKLCRDLIYPPRESYYEFGLMKRRNKDLSDRGDVREKEEDVIKMIQSLKKVNFEDLKFYRHLGSGSYADTYICRIQGMRGIFVAKILRSHVTEIREKSVEIVNRDTLFNMFSESNSSKKASQSSKEKSSFHENIVWCTSTSEKYLISETILPNYDPKNDVNAYREVPLILMRYYHKDLNHYIKQRVKDFRKQGDSVKKAMARFSDLELCYILQGLLRGGNFLHKHKIVHRDLHEENVFIEELYGRIWIGDFGCSLDLRKNKNGFIVENAMLQEYGSLYRSRVRERYTKKGGFADILPPEVTELNDPKNSINEKKKVNYEKCDIFSIGYIGFKLIWSFFERKNKKDEKEDAFFPFGVRDEGERRRDGDLIELLGPNDNRIKELIKGMLKCDIDDRWDYGKALNRVDELVEDFERKYQKKENSEEEEIEGVE